MTNTAELKSKYWQGEAPVTEEQAAHTAEFWEVRGISVRGCGRCGSITEMNAEDELNVA